MSERKWTVVTDEFHNARVLEEDGTEADHNFPLWWVYEVKDRYEIKMTWVYLAAIPENQCFKAGITQDLNRRESEIRATMWNFIPCATHKARVLERALHFWLKPFSLGHEWYEANEWREFNELILLKTQAELREFLHIKILEMYVDTGDPKADRFEKILSGLDRW